MDSPKSHQPPTPGSPADMGPLMALVTEYEIKILSPLDTPAAT